MKQIKIIHYLWSPTIGGIERLVLDLANEQVNNKKLFVNILFGINNTKNSDNLSLFENTGIVCRFARLKNGFDFSVSKIQSIKRLFKEFNLIHMHGFNPAIFIAAALSKKKILYTEHGTFAVGRSQKTRELIKKWLKIFFLKNFTNFISFNSKYTQNKANRLYNIQKLPQKIIYNGTCLSFNHLDNSPIKKSIKDKCKNKIIIGTFSRFTYRKRIDRLIEAFSILVKNNPNFTLLLIGDGMEMNKLKSHVKLLHIENNVIFTGYCTNINSYQEIIDICVFPAENEPFGLVAIEALAKGKPTIVFNDGGGLVEIIKPFDKNDVVGSSIALAKRILIHSHEIYNENYKSNRKEYTKRYSIEKMSDTFYKVYNSLLES